MLSESVRDYDLELSEQALAGETTMRRQESLLEAVVS